MYIELDSARIYFDTVGSQLACEPASMREKPTLVVMHGGPGFDHSTLRPYFDRFADTHQVLYIDHRGNGRSSGEPATWNLAQWGDDVKAICDALGIDKPHVYGNSFGGMVAMSYAARHPTHSGKLILSSTAARMRLDVTYAMMQKLGGDEARRIAEKFWTTPDESVRAEYMATCMPLYNPAPNPDQAAARKRALLRGEVMDHFIMGEMRTMDARDGLNAIQCPTLVLAGAHDPITPVACAEEIAESMAPGLAELAIFDSCGHGVHRDDPAAAETVLRRYLAA